MRNTMLTLGLGLAWAITAQLAAAQTTTIEVPAASTAGAQVDFVNARPVPLPPVPARSELAAYYDLIDALQSGQTQGAPGHSGGARGTGVLDPIFLGAPARALDEGELTPHEFGTLNHPFSTARADLSGLATNTAYPYRASGKLFFSIDGSTYLCSASLIKRGIVVTAAHCVAEFGARRFYSNWTFVPGYRNGAAPYGSFTAASATIMTSYFDGTDTCATPGIVCRNDVAVLVLNPTAAGAYPGSSTGWYGYGWDGYGFTGSGLTQITQTGYPSCLDNGNYMERNDSYGYRSAANANNTVIGSLMCGGSSGGPWLINFGVRPALTGTTPGTAASPNVVVGVTSWGYVSSSSKEQGASPFLSGNIKVLVDTVCAGTPAAC
jgi:V8-like Glu-specific endopeptidase